MDNAALAIETMDLYQACEEEYIKRFGDPANVEIVTAVFIRAHTFKIHKNISAERKDIRSDKETKQNEPASQAQLNFIRDLGGMVTDGMSKTEAHRLIEALKK